MEIKITDLRRTNIFSQVLDRQIFKENILFVQAMARCFMKEKLIKNKPYHAKNAKKWRRNSLCHILTF